jgi:Mg2+/Co2+ transporter CorB
MTDHLETFPEAPVSIEINRYRLEVVRLKDNMIATAKLSMRPPGEDD